MAFALYKIPFLSLQHAVLNVFPFELQCIQMYLPASALLSASVSWRHSKKFMRSPAMRTVSQQLPWGSVAFSVAGGLSYQKHELRTQIRSPGSRTARSLPKYSSDSTGQNFRSVPNSCRFICSMYSAC